MPNTLISYANGNLTGASTWKNSETGSGALTMVRANTTTLASNTTVTSPAFTITNAKVIEGVMLWVMANQATPAGTLTVNILKSGVSQTSVTVNCADLPHSATGTNDVLAVVPCFFKFTGTATGDGTANWTINMVTSNVSGAQITYSRNSATTGDFTKALRTSTTATAAAGDDLYILGELSGAGTHNSFTVTMDSTAATAYGNATVNTTSVNGGGVRISAYGSLTYGTTASTNYILRVAGDVEVFWNGTLTGTLGDRTNTNVLELVMTSASGDFGLLGRSLSTITINGLSRTAAKAVTKCKLTSDVTGSSVLNSQGTTTNATLTANNAVDFSNTSLLASTLADTVTNATHSQAYGANGAVTNTTQVATIFLARGSGTNNRFVRFSVGNASVYPHTNGFFADIDLQAGTIGTCTALGNGTATSSSITACGTGYVCTITGKASSGSQTPNVLINICSASGTTSFAGAGNQSLIFEGVSLVTASSISTTFNVDTDTGWLSGDVFCIASTTRTNGDNENFNLSSNAGATSFSSALYPYGYGGPTTSQAATHSGTSPFIAELGLLTHYIKFRSTSSSLWTYVFLEPLCTATISYVEFYYNGSNAGNKRGIEMNDKAATNAKSITFCSFHECWAGLFCSMTGLASLGVTFSNNVLFNLTNVGITVTNNGPNDYTLDNNLVIKAGSNGINIADFRATFTNNTFAGCTGIGIQHTNNVGSVQAIGTCSGNTAHSNSSQGLAFQNGGPCITGSIASFTLWRNNSSAGLTMAGGIFTHELTWDNLVMFGNLNRNISWATADVLTLNGGSLSSDTTFTTTTGIDFLAANLLTFVVLQMNGVDMGGTGTGLAAHGTTDLRFAGASATLLEVQGIVNGCAMAAGTTFDSKSLWAKSSKLMFQKYKGVAGDDRLESTYGQVKTDTSIFNTVSPSLRMTPNSSSIKLASAPGGILPVPGHLVPVASGVAGSVSAWVRKSAAGDGAAYNGNQPRMMLRRNDALGVTADTVLATYSAGTGAWNQLTATTPVPIDDGCFEVFFDCDGTAGWINVDDVQINQGVLNDGAKFWFRGIPIMTPNQPIARLNILTRGTPY